MSDPTSLKRQLKIKTGVVTRLQKEDTLYGNELAKLKLNLEDVSTRWELQKSGSKPNVVPGSDEGKRELEEWDVKNAGRMLAETEKMIQDTKQRLGKGVLDLRDLVLLLGESAAAGDDAVAREVVESEEFAKAKEALENANL